MSTTSACLEENLASPDRGRSVLTVRVPERKSNFAPGRGSLFCRNSKSYTMANKHTALRNGSLVKDIVKHDIVPGFGHSRNYTIHKKRTTTARTPPCSTGSSCKLFHLAVLSTLLLVYIPEGSSAQQRQNKHPLISTNANSSSEFRELFGVPLGRSTTDNRADPETLDFQTMKSIERWGNTTNILLVIGKNHIYMMDTTKPHSSLSSFSERLTWKTKKQSQRECVLMGKKKNECQNYIRVAELMDNGELMVCGTNAYSPACRYYKREQFNEPKPGTDSVSQSEMPCRDQCIVPYNPATSSATLYTKTANGSHVFTAVINDFLSNDPIIFKRGAISLHTNPMWLNDPTFLKMIEYRDKVYVFFREIAKESESGTSEKVTYARVAQICKDDVGGVNVLSKQWTSFLKARLLCGIPGRQHLQFNNMTSVSDIVSIEDESGQVSDAVIASFTTPWEWTDASLSAVCVFAMKDIMHLFETGSFSGEYVLDAKPQEKPEMPSMGRPSFSAQNSMRKITRSYPVPEDDMPIIRPGSCSTSLGANLDPSVLSFAKEHPLMYKPVTPFFGRPVFVTYNNVRATQIAVDEIEVDGGKHTMIYLGTESGEVMRLRGVFDQQGPKAVLIETIAVGGACIGDNCSIRSLNVLRQTNPQPSLFVAFTHNILQFSLTRCEQYINQRCCSVDPDCGWNGIACVPRAYEKRRSLEPVARDIKGLPMTCQKIAQISTPGCGCKGGKPCPTVENGEESGPVVTALDPNLLDGLIENGEPSQVSLRNILLESLLPTVEEKYREIVDKLKNPSQRNAMVTQLTQALKDTTNLVLNNHQQEYCLPSPTVNHLTHVYPLLLREIELWHQTALKKMSEHEFPNNCWGKGASCFHKVSFSVPLVPILWEPLTKLISDFYGECETITSSTGHQTAHLHHHDSRHGCTPHPGMEKCRDAHSPLCQPKRCTFPRYAVDVKAFFRHVNDSRQFLEHSDRVEPLWKPVNVTLENSGIRGHLELAVSERRPFLIDYSPVAEKVKIIFHYSPVQDCSLTEPRCIGTLPGCNPEVEEVVDHWFDLAMSKITVKLRRCSREINKAKRLDDRDRRRREKRGGMEHRAELSDRSEFVKHSILGPSNFISPSIPQRCKRITAKVGNVRRNLWSLIVSRCQRSGGLYSPFHSSITFYKREDVIRFFKNMCTFLDPTKERKTLRKRTSRGRSESEVQIQVTVSRETPFVIERNVSTGKTLIKYFTAQHLE